MKLIRTVLGLIGSVILAVGATAQSPDDTPPPPGQYRFKTLPLEELSDRNVSRMGDTALNLKDIKWEHGESDHFIFHTETGFLPLQLAVVAEWSYAEIKKDLDISRDLFERKGHIYVFLNEQVWRAFVGNGKLEPWTGGWCTGRELFFQSRPHFRFQGTTLPHEMTHLVMHRFLKGDIPLWLNEGFAEFEGIRLYRTYLRVRNYTLTNIQDRLNRDQYIPLKDLTSAVDYPKTRDEVTAFYVESHMLIGFLCDQHGGMSPLLKFIKLQSEGAQFDSAWQDVYGDKYRDQEAFEKKFIVYLTHAKE
jgi:hypothetical protein